MLIDFLVLFVKLMPRMGVVLPWVEFVIVMIVVAVIISAVVVEVDSSELGLNLLYVLGHHLFLHAPFELWHDVLFD